MTGMLLRTPRRDKFDGDAICGGQLVLVFNIPSIVEIITFCVLYVFGKKKFVTIVFNNVVFLIYSYLAYSSWILTKAFTVDIHAN